MGDDEIAGMLAAWERVDPRRVLMAPADTMVRWAAVMAACHASSMAEWVSPLRLEVGRRLLGGDRAELAVLADRLQTAGDPLGEAVVLLLAGADTNRLARILEPMLCPWRNGIRARRGRVDAVSVDAAVVVAGRLMHPLRAEWDRGDRWELLGRTIVMTVDGLDAEFAASLSHAMKASSAQQFEVHANGDWSPSSVMLGHPDVRRHHEPVTHGGTGSWSRRDVEADVRIACAVVQPTPETLIDHFEGVTVVRRGSLIWAMDAQRRGLLMPGLE